MTLRARHAEVTRRTVLEAARRLFAERGYQGTTIAELADEAGVAVQTIYTSIGSKRGAVVALVDAIDEEAGIPALAPRMAQATQPSEMVATLVQLTRQIQERCGDIIQALASAATVESELAPTLEEGFRRHRAGSERMAGRLAELGALRADVPEQRAAGVIDLLTSHETYMKLTRGCGWSFDECEEWINATLSTLLLRGTETTPSSSAAT